ncbi:RdRP [Fusarium verticillioides mitovirus 1]|uniref:RdRP n=1 Tax=Fusarium verticillioides mitovirus 1 TaxID=2793953 RepID=A0ABX6WLS3_9VIRU|nr:RdRP [Fusarium verticillioides mitovirus 1]QPK91778.1 RdRP [Fusarium verticillioides mitovirus 1]
MKKNYTKILWRIMVLIFPSIDTSKYLRPLFKIIFKMIKNHGTIYTIKYLKRVRLHCTRYICGDPLFTNTMMIGIDKEGWPKVFSFLKPLVNNNLESLKFLFTILNFTRSWDLSKKEWDKIKPDYNSITDKSKMSITIPSGIINKFVKEYRLKSNHPEFDKLKDVYLSTKAGPNGPATLSSQEDLLNFNYPMMDKIFKITDQNGIDFFCKNYTQAFNKNITPSKIRTLGKISFVKDPECKLRIIAISDYYSQLYLKPIHNIIMNKLHNITMDRTYTQDPHHVWEINNEKFWSLDLSSATDRFPVELQKRLLARIFHMELAQSWQSILNSREFTTPEGYQLKYATGQPMGTYSSWSVFTLTHHLVVYYCATINGYKNFDQYIILGDDIVIKNDKVAKTYKKVIKALGVELSESKTHVSSNTYEFAKRWIQWSQNREITGLPLGGILRNINNPNIVFTVLYDYFKIKKNYFPSRANSLVGLVKDLYHKLLLKNKKIKTKNNKIIFRKSFYKLNDKMVSSLESFSLMLDIVFDYKSYDKLRNLFVKNITTLDYNIPSESTILSELKRILSHGLSSRILQMNSNIINSPKVLISKFDIEDKNLLNTNPVFLSIYNTISRFKDIKFEDLDDLHNISKEICEINIENIFNKDRNKIQSLLEIGKILKDGFKYVNNTTEVYYGSATLSDSFTLGGIGKILMNNLKSSELDDIIKGTYTEPQPQGGYASMWENFKM